MDKYKFYITQYNARTYYMYKNKCRQNYTDKREREKYLR